MSFEAVEGFPMPDIEKLITCETPIKVISSFFQNQLCYFSLVKLTQQFLVLVVANHIEVVD